MMIKVNIYLWEQDSNCLRLAQALLLLGDHQITPVQQAKNLGRYFDQQLSMGTEINKTCSALH